ncbi:MAG: four helix bundle protein [Patescibacteria group bacterium]
MKKWEGKNNIKYRAYLFAINVIKTLDETKNKEISFSIIIKQLLRNSTSIGANIIEAQAGSTKKDFINFLNHSLKSSNETKFWLSLLKDTNKIKEHQVNELIKENIEISKILGSIIINSKITITRLFLILHF